MGRYEATTHVQTSEQRASCRLFNLIGHSAGDVSRAGRRCETEVVREDGAEKNTAETRGHHQQLAGVPPAAAMLALHLDDLELHAIRPLKEADPPTIARDHLL